MFQNRFRICTWKGLLYEVVMGDYKGSVLVVTSLIQFLEMGSGMCSVVSATWLFVLVPCGCVIV